MQDSRKIKIDLAILLAISVVIRACLAGWIELGTDEAYYWTFAKYPDLSHFDHPGMIGWVIQLFSLNLLFDTEFFMRLASVVFMTLNTWIMFRIGKELKDEITGLRAALLYTVSIYAFVITGIFILPDTPLSLFWLLAFWMAVKFFGAPRLTHQGITTTVGNNRYLILFGLFAGLSMLSKYSGVFLWVGLGLYLLCYDRQQFKNPSLYLALLISVLCCLPILLWNIQNDFISFRFHGGRVGLSGTLTPNNLSNELSGEFLYNNPVNFILAILAIVAVRRHRLPLDQPIQRLIMLTALPMIGLFWVFSFYRPTLPHWSGPAYILLIFPSALWLETTKAKSRKKFIAASIIIWALVLIIGTTEIKTGFIPLDKNIEATILGKDDVSLDLYGWRQLREKFAVFRSEQIENGEMKEGDALIGNNWFPTASIDYYIAQPLNMTVLGYGPLERIHKYLWINEKRGGFTLNDDYWYLADSHFFIDPEQAYAYTNFKEIKLLGIIPIERNGKVVRNIFVYKCHHLVYIPKALQMENGKLMDKQ